MLKKEYIKDGKNRVIGSVTSGYTGAYETIVKDEHERPTASPCSKMDEMWAAK